MSLVAELVRRNVVRTAGFYLAAGWLLVQIAETVFPLFGYDETPARVTVIVLAIGFIPALLFSWIFQLTPDGLRREDENLATEGEVRPVSKYLDRAIILMLALALIYFSADKFIFAPQREASLIEESVSAIEAAREAGRNEGAIKGFGERSIVVLPFLNIGPDAAVEYFADGITEELLNLLAQVPSLRVISRTSSFSYKGSKLPLAQIAEALNVIYVLEGSVRHLGERVRITTQLIDSRTDNHLWSHTYEREIGDIFAIQDDIAVRTVDQLKIRLLGEAPRVAETDPRAYGLSLQARYTGNIVSRENIEFSNELYRQALAIDPTYAPAWVGLAVNHSNQATNSFVPFGEGFARAREAAERALEADPQSAGAYAYLGWVAMWFDYDLPAAAKYYETALALRPTETGILGNAALLLKGLGRFDEALSMVEFQVSRDPLNPTAKYNLGLSYLSAARWADASEQLEGLLKLAPEYTGAHAFLGTAQLMLGFTDRALEVTLQEPSKAYRLLGLAMIRHKEGDSEASNAALAEVIEEFGQQWAYNIAYTLAFCGDTELAFEWLDKAVEYQDPGLADIVAEVLFTNLHTDPRWDAFLERIGKSPEALAAIEFRVTMPRPRQPEQSPPSGS